MADEGKRPEEALAAEVVRLRQELTAIEHARNNESTQAIVAQQAEVKRLKANLLSTMSHELRTPLAAIKGYSTMLLDYESRMKREERREYLRAIDKATDRLDQLLANFLDNARLEAGMLKLGIGIHQVADLVDKALSPYEPHHLPGDRCFSVQVDEGMPLVAADGRRIRQVIGHLVDNAIKYSTPGSRITIQARSNDQRVVISVANKGSNIPPQDLEAIFQPLFRLEHRDASASGSGLNLSLALCKAIVDMHDGSIHVESDMERGTVFSISLPIADTTSGDDLDRTE